MGTAVSTVKQHDHEKIQLTILHFNDVYNVEETTENPCGGAARFAGALTELRSKNPDRTLLLFSGDLLSPSSLSMTTEGAHMVDLLNLLMVDCCVIGNHDFDFGVDNLLSCIEKSKFPWLNGNCYDASSMELLCGLPPCHIIERGDVRIGLIGLVEPEWVDTLAVVDQGQVVVKDFCIEGRRLANELRTSHDCHVIIALTHMRWPNDLRLAKEVPEIDLVLGGHDHNAGIETVKCNDGTNRKVIKSGTDFRQLGYINLFIDPQTKNISKIDVEIKAINKSWKPNEEIATFVSQVCTADKERLDRVIGKVDVDLDGRFAMIRTQETNMGNFLADVALTCVEADCAVINSGSMRNDSVIPAGDFTLRQLSLILPMLDSVIVLDVTGSDIVKVLENGVSQVPKLEGRFPQVAQITFSFRADRPKGQRVDPTSVQIGGNPLVLEQRYRLATTPFMANGKDGYDMLMNKRRILDEEAGIPLSTAVINYFRTINVLNGFIKLSSRHRHRLITMKERNRISLQVISILKSKLAKPGSVEHSAAVWTQKTQQQNAAKKMVNAIAKGAENVSPKDQWKKIRDTLVELEKKQCKVAPKVEGRIVQLE
ncbi:hypothetical protein CRM22_006999 [Opisthorchis felineus]|uniref:5'-Nucleotidase C-terminal domain-containing protein n=1 Tax=Opisthorchis felineus TaxID=147828 RepID=A0A4S2LQR6_OPIFE|nr:hypothetical protein CRM22_006999 [Opisthorchis felineus]